MCKHTLKHSLLLCLHKCFMFNSHFYGVMSWWIRETQLRRRFLNVLELLNKIHKTLCLRKYGNERRSYYLLESCNFKTEANSPSFLEQWSLPTTAALAAEFLTCHFITNGHIWKSKCHRYTGQCQVSEDASGGYSCGFLRTSADFAQ